MLLGQIHWPFNVDCDKIKTAWDQGVGSEKVVERQNPLNTDTSVS